MQQEWVTTCTQCGTKLYCQDGFFQGVQLPNGTSLCFECSETSNEDPNAPTEA